MKDDRTRREAFDDWLHFRTLLEDPARLGWSDADVELLRRDKDEALARYREMR